MAVGRPSTGYRSIASVVTIRSNDSHELSPSTGPDSDAAAIQLIMENEKVEINSAGDFEDIDELELGMDPVHISDDESIEKEYSNAVKHWPFVSSLKLRRQILEKGKLKLFRFE